MEKDIYKIMITLILFVDTNNYISKYEWSLLGLELETLHEWKDVGATDPWFVEGDRYTGTIYTCKINYTEELLLQHLVEEKIRKACGDRFLKLEIDGVPVQFYRDEEGMEMMMVTPSILKKLEDND